MEREGGGKGRVEGEGGGWREKGEGRGEKVGKALTSSTLLGRRGKCFRLLFHFFIPQLNSVLYHLRTAENYFLESASCYKTVNWSSALYSVQLQLFITAFVCSC